ncbi:MAG: Dabb family protein [Bacillota bacterium]|nr:Dabb family protein [Bacillota bacterium]
MVKHFVLFRLLDNAEGKTKDENAKFIKQGLEALNGVVPGLIRLEVGINFKPSETASDVVVNAEFEDKDALEGYIVHPQHQAVAQYIAKVRSERRVIDYIV